jgi:hypothetical protein
MLKDVSKVKIPEDDLTPWKGRLDPIEWMILLAKSKNLTPQPPSLQGKGEHESPSK